MSWWDTIKKPTAPDVSTYNGLPDDLDDWGCSDWQVYHTRCKKIYGLAQANEFFYIDVARLHAFSDMWICKYDCDFLQYLKNNGIEYNSIISNSFC